MAAEALQAVDGSPFNLIAGESPNCRTGSVQLDSGYYRIIFTLKKDCADYTRPVVWRETLHVYSNMTSHFVYEFKSEHFRKNSFIVRYDYNHSNLATRLASYFNNSTDYAPESTPNRDGWTFGGWYTAREGGELWDFNTPLAGDLNLYARWIGIPQLSLSNNAIEFGSIVAGDLVPQGKTITITNDGTGDAVNAAIESSCNGSLFTVSGLSSDAITAGGGQVSFTVQPNNGLSAGQYNAEITITYAGGTSLTVSVTFTVEVKFSGHASTNIGLNSNNLLDIPGVRYGWYAKQVSGKWLRKGYMKVSGEDKQMSIAVPAIDFPFTNLNNNAYQTWSGDLDNNLGAYVVTTRRTGSNVCFHADINIYIPHDTVNIYFQVVGQTTRIYQGNDSTHNCYVFGGSTANPAGRSSCWFVGSPGGNSNIQLKIDVESYTSFEYDEQTDLPYPIFQQGGLYYWQIQNCIDTCGTGCIIKNDQHVKDFWSVTGDPIKIIEFNPGVHDAQGNIIIRSWDPNAEGVSFREASQAYIAANSVSGLDIDAPLLDPSKHYRQPVSFDLTIDGEDEPVGTAIVKIVDHVQDPATLVISRVTLEIKFELKPEFAPYVDRIILGGTVIPANNTITVERNHGNITLPLEFVFK